MITEQDFTDFKQRVQVFIDKNQMEIYKNFQKRFNNFKDNYSLIKSIIDENNAREAFDFNVFEIIGFSHLEVRTHTPFLGELLNPLGSHGQGNLFLKTFFQFFNSLSPTEISDSNWKVIKESELIDLRIVNYKLKKAIFIENKIYTGAHSGQLSRYYKKWRERFSNGGQFIYLTINGSPPDETGFDDSIDQNYPRDVIKRDLLCFSYKKHIKEWLKMALPSIQAPRVKETIHQYLHLIDNL